MSITKQLHPFLVDLLPSTWDVYSVEEELDVLERPAVLLSYTRSSVVFGGPHALGKRYDVTLTYVSPITWDLSVVDDDLWDAEQTVEAALQELPFVELTESSRGTYGDDGEDNFTNWAHVFALTVAIPYTPPTPDSEEE